MKRERVSIIEGEIPVLLVAPHGANCDDENTGELTEYIANKINAFAVINNSWKRNSQVDIYKDFANCNDINHLNEDVVKDEFLNPILRYVARIQRDIEQRVIIFYIHGCGNYVRQLMNDPKLDLIIGYGAGDPQRYTCNPKMKDAFAFHLEKEGIKVYQGKAGGPFSGHSRNNLNQYFRSKKTGFGVIHSMQLELVKALREDDVYEITGELLADAIEDLMMFDDTTNTLIKIPEI